MSNKRSSPTTQYIKSLSFDYYDDYLKPKKTENSKYLHWRFFSSFKYKKPTTKLNIHSKRHITIVILMILAIVAMFIIAYFQGVFK